MSIEEYEATLYNIWYAKLLYNRKAGLSIDEFFDESSLKDTKKINYVLEKCSRSGDMETINCLLSRGVTLGIVNEDNQTVIHIGSLNLSSEAVHQLFQHYGTNVNYVDVYGLSHFDVACESGNFEIVEKFLKNGAVNPNGHCHEHSLWHDRTSSPLDIAVLNYRLEVVKLLLEYGANPNPLPHVNGSSPLHFLCYGKISKDREILQLLYSTKRISRIKFLSWMMDSVEQNCELEIAKLLVEYKCNVNIRNVTGDTPMHCIFNHNHFEEIDEIFPFSECDINIKRQIIHGYRNRQKRMVEFMLSNGADVRAINNNGDTVLHLAIRDLRESREPPYLDAMQFDDDIIAEIVVKLLDYGADVNAKNDLAQSPLQLAFTLLSFKVVKVLLERNADVAHIELDCFHYIEHVVPCLEATENLINIIDALKNKGFYLNHRNNLTIMKSFVNNCYLYLGMRNWNDEETCCQIKSLLEFATDSNIILGLNTFWKGAFYDDQIIDINKSKYRKTLLQIFKHLLILENGDLYASQEIKDLLYAKVSSLDLYSLFKSERDLILLNIRKEVKEMKATILSDCVSLHSILSSDPGYCYKSVKKCDYRSIISSESFRIKFSDTMGIIEGYFSKALVRWYFMNSAKDYLNTLIDDQLPYLCCNKILSLLDSCETVLKKMEESNSSVISLDLTGMWH